MVSTAVRCYLEGMGYDLYSIDVATCSSEDAAHSFHATIWEWRPLVLLVREGVDMLADRLFDVTDGEGPVAYFDDEEEMAWGRMAGESWRVSGMRCSHISVALRCLLRDNPDVTHFSLTSEIEDGLRDLRAWDTDPRGALYPVIRDGVVRREYLNSHLHVELGLAWVLSRDKVMEFLKFVRACAGADRRGFLIR